MNLSKLEFKAGRFIIDRQTKRVKPEKAKGKIIVQRNQQDQTHFKWIDTDSMIQQLDIIVFPMDAKFEAVQSKKNTFLLKFGMDTDLYYFWLQQKVQAGQFVQRINELINCQVKQQQQSIAQQKPVKLQQMEPQIVEQPINTTQKPIFGEDFISKLTKNLIQAQKNQETNITDLQRILNHQTIGKILNELTQQERMQMVCFLPQEQQKLEFLDQNVRSPQFLQALDALSEAFNGQTAIAIFAEMGLNQSHLQKHYGVHAFIKALVEWGKQQKK